MTQEIAEELQINKKKLPKYQEIYYRVMIKLLHWLIDDTFGQRLMLFMIIGIFLMSYALILLLVGIKPDEKRWETFSLGIACSVLGIYCWLFYLPIKMCRLANRYRKKIGVELFVYGPPYDLKSN